MPSNGTSRLPGSWWIVSQVSTGGAARREDARTLEAGVRATVRRAGGRLGGGDGLAERGAQVLLLLGVEGGLDHFAPVLLDAVEDLLRGVAPAEVDERRAARGDLLAELLHEVVVDARVGDLAGRGAARRSDRHAQQRGQEQQADEAAPQRAPGRPGARRAHGLVQLDL